MSTGNYSQPWNGSGGTGSVGSVPFTVNAPKSDTPIRDGVSRVEELIMTLHQGIDGLEKRLDVVLEPEGPAPLGKDVPGQAQMASHFRGRVDTIATGLQDAINRIQRLHQRIEL